MGEESIAGSNRIMSGESSFYSDGELRDLGLASVGRNVLLSRKTSLYSRERIHIGDCSRVDDFVILSGAISLGRHVHIAAYCALYAQNSPITIDDFVGLAARVTVYTYSDDFVYGTSLTNPTVPDRFKTVVDCASVAIGRHALVGAGSVVLPGSELGVGCVVGALSLVRGTLPGWQICTGNPAKEQGSRRSRRILELERQLRQEEGW